METSFTTITNFKLSVFFTRQKIIEIRQLHFEVGEVAQDAVLVLVELLSRPATPSVIFIAPRVAREIGMLGFG